METKSRLTSLYPPRLSRLIASGSMTCYTGRTHPRSYPRNSHSRMNYKNFSNFPCKNQNNVRNQTRRMPLVLTVARNMISWKNSNDLTHLLVWTSFLTGVMTSSQRKSHQISFNDLGISMIIGSCLRFMVYVLRHPTSRLKPENQIRRI